MKEELVTQGISKGKMFSTEGSKCRISKPQSIKQKEAGHSKFDVQEETNDRRIFRNMTNTSFLHSSDAKEQLGQPLDTTQFL